MVAQPLHWREAKKDRDLRQHAVDGVHHHVFPQECVDGGHHKKRRDQKQTYDGAPGKGLVNEQCQAHAQHHGDQNHTAEQQDGVEDGRGKRGVRQEVFEIFQAVKTGLVGLHQVVADERKIHRHGQRHQHPQQQGCHSRCQQ